MRPRHGSVQEHLIAANAERVYQVTRADLPLHCPTPSMYLWNSHPKVYLPIEVTGEAKCPYCSSTYRLVEDDAR
ncbi:MAG TPA: zinc-finger domain-containing protein [Gammaproteobacteria bacterium]|nr:zinc-finger domain-containing protein [Gammaproteobacteria bacterium]